jgi:hypothetical protein
MSNPEMCVLTEFECDWIFKKIENAYVDIATKPETSSVSDVGSWKMSLI